LLTSKGRPALVGGRSDAQLMVAVKAVIDAVLGRAVFFHLLAAGVELGFNARAVGRYHARRLGLRRHAGQEKQHGEEWLDKIKTSTG